MIKLLTCWLAMIIVAICTVARSEETIQAADALYESGGLKNYKQAAAIYASISDKEASNFEAAWKAARTYREYAEAAKTENVDDWQAICKDYGKLAMNYGERAIKLKPDAIEGHFWFGCSVGNYSDGVSVLTALREGLKSKTQAGLEKAYEIDKSYRDGGPIKALGRFWFVLPWPFADKELAMKYLREFQQAYPDDAEGQVFLAEALIDRKEKTEAKALLEKAAATEDVYYASWAKRLLAELK